MYDYSPPVASTIVRATRLAASVALIALAAACAGSEGTPAAADNVAFRLPARPSQLGGALVQADDYQPQDRIRSGAQFSDSLPAELVAADGMSARFSPQWAPDAVPPGTQPAYALYTFSLPGYSEQPQLGWNWVEPGAADNAWLGLSRWQRDSWDWYQVAGDSLELASLAEYLSEEGTLVAAVVALGDQQVRLNWLRVGGNVPPTASLTASHTQAPPGTEVEFDASASEDPDGQIVRFEWDVDGDGFFEIDGGTVPTISHVYTSAGIFRMSVRVTDEDGAADAVTRFLTIGSGPSSFTDFESGWDGWQPDSTDVFVSPGDEIDWTVELTQDLAYSGDTSVLLEAENRTDACKLWIERSYEVLPNTNYTVTLSYRFGTNAAGEVGTWTVLAGGLNYDPENRVDLLDVGQMQRESTYNGGIPELVWLDKQYEFDVTSGADGRIWVVAGVWGVFEVLQTYYIDDVAVVLTPTSAL